MRGNAVASGLAAAPACAPQGPAANAESIRRGAGRQAGFSLDGRTIADVLRHAKPLGHNERARDHNLGFGFVYYGLVRATRPGHVLVIGSGYGFSVACLALGVRDNGEGAVTFVDPSYSLMKDGPFKTIGGRASWSDPAEVRERFSRFGVEDIVTHHRLTSEEFFASYDDLGLPPLDLTFIDGNHSYRSVRHDFLSALARSGRNALLLLHDTNIYIREALRHAGVRRWVEELRAAGPAFDVLDLPLASGVALVRVADRKRAEAWARAL